VVDAMLDNVRSAWNVGSIFRSADGLGISHLYLCGITPTPENSKVTKTSLGTEKTISWSQHNNGVYAAIEVKKRGLRLWALESDDRSYSIHNALGYRSGRPIVLVVGNEVCGVDPGILELCERTVHIPMIGVKRSLNVAVAFGIASHSILYG
jgi:tRNA G18 (ribose-2'-O)-methylase SpoU